MNYTYSELCRCARRELFRRRKAYSAHILANKMTTEKAATEIAKMEAIVDVLAKLMLKKITLDE